MKTRLFALCLAACLLLGGCNKGDETSATTTTTQAPQPTNPIEAYKTMERRVAEIGYETSSYTVDGTDLFLDLSLPADWFLTPISNSNGSRYSIDRDGYDIGTLSLSNADDLAAWQTLESRENSFEGVSIKEYVEAKPQGDIFDFRYRYTYTYAANGTDQTLTLTVNYSEVDDETAFELFENVHLENTQQYTRFGLLSVKERSEILLLGNSFIGSSDIGEILTEMLQKNGKKNTAYAISRGYATVNTYASDESLLDEIRNGYYGIVFICGFYGQVEQEIAALGILKGACDASNTPLVIFPAHNENRGTISKAMETYPTLKVLDWKAEVDALIDGGVAWNDMCVNDQHNHSKPLAGYVGAHMIYRALYGTVPTDTSSSILGSTLYKLGSYPQTGCTKEAITLSLPA